MISSRDLALVVKNPPTNAEDIRLGLITRSGRSPAGGHSNPLQSSCLENPPGHWSLEGYSPWGHRVGHNSSDLAYSTGIRKLSNFTPLTNSLLKWKRKSLSHVQLFATPWLYSPWKARILEWVAFPFSRGSSQSRDWTQVSCIAGQFFTSWAAREAQEYWSG